jgi:excisionase family DNA binding protein
MIEMEPITHNNLPQAVAELLKMAGEIKGLLLDNNKECQPETDQFLTIQQAAEFLKLSVPTLYGKVHTATIPVFKKGKRLYFSKQELKAWIESGRIKTINEIEAEADQYLSQRSKRK